MALHIKVVDEADRRDADRLRAGVHPLASTAFLSGRLHAPGVRTTPAARDGRRQTFHDKFAHSVVVRT
jgi:hypothetical protein